MRTTLIQKLAREVLSLQATPAGAGIPRRPFGRAGDPVSIIALGGWHSTAQVALENKDESEAIRLMHAAIDEGVGACQAL